jgi:predicted dehydrogenase
MRAPVNVAIVGTAGASELAQVLSDLPHVRLRWFCGHGAGARESLVRAAWQSPALMTTTELSDVLDDEEVDAVVFDTDPFTRGNGPAEALAADKHVFVRGPLATNVVAADQLVALAEGHDRRLRAYHEAPFTPGARRLRSLIDAGALGDLFYLTGSRSGVAGPGTHVLWQWGAGLVALVLDLLGDQPVEVSARGESHVRADVLETVVADLRFATGISASLHISGVDRAPAARLTVVGSQLTAVVDAEERRELALYGSSMPAPPDEDGLGSTVTYPPLTAADPLRTALEGFVAAVRSRANLGGARESAAVVGVLEALQRACSSQSATEPFRFAQDTQIIQLRAN